uniref:Uncharacterized protein n=1 Tax=viral metagenome TaxID=1070528 RepID=A0A6C0HCU7_9ZZZZ
MDSFQDLFKKKNIGEMLLGVLFIVYLIMGYKTPSSLASVIDTTYGKVIVVLVALLLFANCNPILGVLGFFVAYNLISKSEVVTGTYGLNNYMPTEEKKYSALTMYNQFPYTLEQEVVKKMAPLNKADTSGANTYSFNPVLDDLHDAAPVNYTGVI